MLVCDPRTITHHRFVPAAEQFRTDPDGPIMRWAVDVHPLTKASHLGLETQRQWSGPPDRRLSMVLVSRSSLSPLHLSQGDQIAVPKTAPGITRPPYVRGVVSPWYDAKLTGALLGESPAGQSLFDFIASVQTS